MSRSSYKMGFSIALMILYFGLLSSQGSRLPLYVPGYAAVYYCPRSSDLESKSVEKDCMSDLSVYVNRLNTEKNILPLEYGSFDFCPGAENVFKSPPGNLGQVLFGDRIRPSQYKLQFLKDMKCETVCEKKYKPGDEASSVKLDFLKRGIHLNYQHHWIIDHMPVTWCYTVVSGRSQYCSLGFPMGCYVTKTGVRKDACVISAKFNKNDTYYIFNHAKIVIEYHPEEVYETGQVVKGRITSAKIVPESIDHSKGDCGYAPALGIPGEDLTKELNIKYTYSVQWRENKNVQWASRWDYILESTPETSVQWFSIFNSIIVVIFLTGLVGIMLWKILRKDISRYSQMINLNEAQNDFGWRAIHSDVFRPPGHCMLLAVLVGNGVQLLVMTSVTLAFAALGMLSPANPGALMTCALFPYVFSGAAAGYISGRLYKSFGGDKWKSTAVLTGLLCSGIVFCIFLVLNLVLWYKGSSAVVPLPTVVQLLSLWLGVSLPLVFLGAHLGFRRGPKAQPRPSNEYPRQIPRQPFYTRTLPSMILGGVLPFGCIFIQLFFILNSFWTHQIYYKFGFLLVVFFLLIITTSETSILFCYAQLCKKSHRWWWKSFLASGFTAVYLFLYGIHFYVTKLEMSGFTNLFLYFGYMSIMAFLVFIAAGCIGFLACFWFVTKIYSTLPLQEESSLEVINTKKLKLGSELTQRNVSTSSDFDNNKESI